MFGARDVKLCAVLGLWVYPSGISSIYHANAKESWPVSAHYTQTNMATQSHTLTHKDILPLSCLFSTLLYLLLVIVAC